MQHDTSMWWLPLNVAEHGPAVDGLWTLITWLVGVTFVAVELLLLWFCWKYRRREGAPKPHYTHGSHKLEVAWTLAPTAILVALGIFSNTLWDRLKTSPPEEDEIGVTIKVVAQRFSWNIFYAGPNGVFDTPDEMMLTGTEVLGDDIFRDRSIVIPVDEYAMLKLTSKDVLHSFFIPYGRVKQDAVPGYVGNVWFKLIQVHDPGPDGKLLTGDDDAYEVACAELCGDSHYNMNAKVYVVPRADFDAWIANANDPSTI